MNYDNESNEHFNVTELPDFDEIAEPDIDVLPEPDTADYEEILSSNPFKRLTGKRKAKREAKHKPDSLKHPFNSIKSRILLYKFPLLIELLKWLIVDILRRFKHVKQLHIYGIWCFVGIYGGGKTMSLVEYLERMRKKHGDGILIGTNFFYSGEDFHIKHWEDLLTDYDRPVIFAYDELQNEFNSREYKSFPTSLMVLLTQNRKGKGKQIVYTAQDYETVDKNFRRLTQKVVSCRTLFGRLTHCRCYPREAYDNLISTPDISRKMKMHVYMKSRWFVQSDYLRSRYDSYQMLNTAKRKQYMDRVTESQ